MSNGTFGSGCESESEGEHARERPSEVQLVVVQGQMNRLVVAVESGWWKMRPKKQALLHTSTNSQKVFLREKTTFKSVPCSSLLESRQTFQHAVHLPMLVCGTPNVGKKIKLAAWTRENDVNVFNETNETGPSKSLFLRWSRVNIIL